jgi:hypothetical protein
MSESAAIPFDAAFTGALEKLVSPGKRPFSFPGLVGKFRRATGAVRAGAPWPFSRIGGPLTHAAVLTALGAGGGYAYGRYLHPLVNPDTDPRAAGRVGAVAGGALAALSRIPELSFQIDRYGWGGINKPSAYRTSGSGATSRLPGPGPFDHGFSAGHARDDIMTDRYLTPAQRHSLVSMIPPGRGMVTGADLLRGAAGAAIGYAGAGVAANVLGTVFGIQRTTQKKLRGAGAVAGALYNSGIFGR